MRVLYILACAGLLGLSACSENAQRLEAAEQAGYTTDDWPQQLRARTLRQNESGRIY